MRPQLPDSIQSTMNALTTGLHPILGSRLIGVYLGGSPAMGDFAETADNLDLLVVTDGELSPEDLLALSQLHHELRSKYPYASRLEGDYVPVALLVPSGTTSPVPGCERGLFLPRVGEVMLTALTLETLRRSGIAFYGPQPGAVLPAVMTAHLAASAIDLLSDLPGKFASPAEIASCILTWIRCAYTYETGELTTKTAGAQWALTQFNQSWHPVIRAAVNIRGGHGEAADAELLSSALPGINQMLREHCSQLETSRGRS